MINGRGFPDSVADNYASWLPAQPYGALARIHPYNNDSTAGANYHPYPAIERFINVGTEEYPFHPHGQNGLVIGRDGNPLEGPGGEDLAFEKFDVNIGPGQNVGCGVQMVRRGKLQPRKSCSRDHARSCKHDCWYVLQR